ncbi:MAG: T9SS type A sorting domain-containing protein [Bacteroidales bacterium]|nr:T9SS type A sorting domain-containing protein [Bacteroidales bacterium]
MIRKSLLTMVLLAIFGFVSAQSLQFELNGHVYADGDEVLCNEPNLIFDEMIQHFQIRNNSSEAINVVVKKEEVEVLEGTMNYFCWGLCLSPEVYVSQPVPMEAGAVSGEEDFAIHVSFDPEWTMDPAQWLQGVVVIKYTAYNERNEDDKVSIIVKFESDITSVDENQVSMSQAYPNPASSVVRFDVNCEGAASVALYNLLGQEVLTQDVENDQVVLSVADLNEGIYFCNLKVNGQVVRTEKFIVKK